MDSKMFQIVFLKIWGCEAYVKWQICDKLAPKSNKCVFVGYPKETKGYYFYLPFENKCLLHQMALSWEEKLFQRELVGVKFNLQKFKIHK